MKDIIKKNLFGSLGFFVCYTILTTTLLLILLCFKDSYLAQHIGYGITDGRTWALEYVTCVGCTVGFFIAGVVVDLIETRKNVDKSEKL